MALLLLVSISVSPTFRRTLKDVLRHYPFVWGGLALFVLMQVVQTPLSRDVSTSPSRIIVSQTNWTAVLFVAATYI